MAAVDRSSARARRWWWGAALVGALSLSPVSAAVRTAWQLLDDGDPAPYPAVAYFDTNRQHVRIVEYLGNGTYGVQDGRPPFVWELVGDDWKRITLPEPTPKNVRGCAAYDTDRRVLIVFGNFDSDDTWEYDGTHWAQMSPSTRPSPRHACSMTYDSNRHQTVMFGGTDINGFPLGDTWEYDGTNWVRKNPSSAPSPRYWAGMTFDSGNKVVLLFGGSVSVGGPWYAETWTYDGTSWKRKSLSTPAPRAAPGMVYDPGRARTVLFGGFTASQTFADTWEWDGRSWSQVLPAQSPTARWSFGMAYDAVAGKMMGFGGDSGALLGDTWRYDLTTWTRIAISALPPQRRNAGMVYDPSRDRVVLHGGSNSTNPPPFEWTDTWLFDGRSWQLDDSAGVTSANSGVRLAYQPSRSRIVGFSGGRTAAPNQDLHTYSGNPGMWLSTPSCCPAPDGRSPALLVDATSFAGGFLLFGGYLGGGYLANDTWILQDGDVWSRQSPPNAPTPRHDNAIAADLIRRNVILQGGSLVGGAYGGRVSDTWRYDGSSWVLLSDPSPPGPRQIHSMTYDASRDRMVLFGDGPWNEAVTWEFDGSQWNAVSTPTMPDPDRCDTQITYDSTREVVWLYGGVPCPVDIYLNDTWAYGADPDGDGIVGKLDNCPSIANPSQTDTDADQHGDACDCAPGDPTAWGSPQPVTGLAVAGSATTSLTWDDQAPAIGSGAQYDVATGLVSDLHGSAGYGAATCLASRVGVPSASDARTPAVGDGFYYLVRSRNVCGIGTYEAPPLDAASPCP